MATPINCTVVTPNAIIFEEAATYISFQAWDGQVGVMPGASPFLAKLGTGALTVTLATGSTKRIITDAGFAQMQGNQLTVLADSIIDVSNIDAKQAAAQLQEANEKAIAPGATSAAAREIAEHAQRTAQAKVSAATGRTSQRS